MAPLKKKRIQIRKFPVTQYQADALKQLCPPENITVSEWAENYRVLDSKTSALPGPWRNDKTPYLKEIMDELINYDTERIIFVKPTQVGGTEALQNMLGYVIQQDPSQFFPYFIVRIEEGNTPTDDEPWLVGTTVLFGICDYNKETNGHRTILEMITKITNRFLERPLLDSKFRANQNVSFALQDEDTYPFYFGAIDIKFYVPKIGRSDDWS